jgi:outer membrane protein assembly factor BamB
MLPRRFAACVLIVGTSATLLADNWPQWRGPSLNGVSGESGLPIKWTTTQGISWKLAMPGFSGSTPIVWGERIFLNVATADTSGGLELWAIDRNTGQPVWKRPLAGGNHQERKQNMSSPSPVTDGEHVWVMTGVGILKAFDFSGQEIWTRDIQRDHGRFGLNWGYASSPLLHMNGLYVEVLHGMKTDAPSYVMRIDKLTGKTAWRVERPTRARNESPDAYTTPALLEYGGKTEIVVTGGDAVTGHDPETGRELWRADVLNPDNDGANRIVASPFVAGAMIVAPSRNNPLVGLRPGGSGDVSRSHVAWKFARGPDVPTPVSDGTYVYVVTDNGIVYCLDLKTGATVYGPVRLPSDDYSASPVLADGKIYVTSENRGMTSVFRAGPKFELLATNTFEDYCLSSPAISDGQIFIRTTRHLWAVGERKVLSSKF